MKHFAIDLPLTVMYDKNIIIFFEEIILCIYQNDNNHFSVAKQWDKYQHMIRIKLLSEECEKNVTCHFLKVNFWNT